MSAEHLPETIPGLVARAAEQFGAHEALVDEHARLSFADLAAQAARGPRPHRERDHHGRPRRDLGAELS